jgi:hypothetical protein
VFTAPEPEGVEILRANCLALGRRQFVEVAANFPEACRYVLETLGSVCKYHAEARAAQLSPQDRLLFHQQHSEPILTTLQQSTRELRRQYTALQQMFAPAT